MSTLNHELNQVAGVRTRAHKRGLKCWTRFNRNGNSYIVCNGSKGQRRTRKKKRNRTSSSGRTRSRYSLRSMNRNKSKRNKRK